LPEETLWGHLQIDCICWQAQQQQQRRERGACRRQRAALIEFAICMCESRARARRKLRDVAAIIKDRRGFNF